MSTSPFASCSFSGSVTKSCLPAVPSSVQRMVSAPDAWNSSCNVTIFAERKPHIAVARSPYTCASDSIGGLPIPPPTTTTCFASGRMVKPCPSGPRMSTFSPARTLARASVPVPFTSNTMVRVPAALLISQIEIGRRSVQPTGSRCTNCPHAACCAMERHCSTMR